MIGLVAGWTTHLNGKNVKLNKARCNVQLSMSVTIIVELFAQQQMLPEATAFMISKLIRRK